MNIYLASAHPKPEETYVLTLRQLAQQDRFRVHTLTEDAVQADIILFLDANRHSYKLAPIRSHPLVSAFRDKVFLYQESDQPWCALPGLYVSMPKSAFNPQRQRACSYLLNNLSGQEKCVCVDDQPDLLFSFMGRAGCAVRERILKLSDIRAHVEDTSAFNFFGNSSETVNMQRLRYSNILRRSKFVLCPRGSGTASFRLFETMAAGRVPVILSDEWVAPSGPEWSRCALLLPENQVERLPGLLASQEWRYASMAEEARRAWELWFAPDVLFHRLVESCKEILDNRRVPEALWQRMPDRRHFRLCVRALKARWLSAHKETV